MIDEGEISSVIKDSSESDSNDIPAEFRMTKDGKISAAILSFDTQEDAQRLYDLFWEDLFPKTAERLKLIDIHREPSLGNTKSQFYAGGVESMIAEPLRSGNDGEGWRLFIRSDDMGVPLDERVVEWFRLKGFIRSEAEGSDLSIIKREVIDAPSNFISVYHESLASRLPLIDREGLVSGSEPNIMANSPMQEKNRIIDGERSPQLIEKGISRNNTYGYLFLGHGHGLMGATERYLPRNAGKSNEDLRSEFPGEVLELKVDPEKAYVADMGIINDIPDIVERRGMPLERVASVQGKDYWQKLMTLKEFQEWFQEDPREYDWLPPSYTRKEEAPDMLPQTVRIPEVLIPTTIPPEQIRVLK